MRSFYKLITFLVIIGVGSAIGMALIKAKPQAKRRPVSIAAPLVEFTEVNPLPQQIVVNATGTVIPAREVSLKPQVSGVVVWQSPRLVAGSRFKAGEVLLRIDPRDYELAVAQQRAALTKARVELETEQGRTEVARREWELLKDDVEYSESGRNLALRKPQLENARAGIEAAQGALTKAELDLERTVIKAPFNAVIIDEQVDVGQFLAPGVVMATLAGSDTFRVQASLNLEELAWIDVPGVNAERGSPVRIMQNTGSEGHNHTGEVERLLTDVDAQGRMARLLIRVPDPLDTDSALPLLLGAYVKAEIAGRTVNTVYAIASEALRGGDTVWLLTKENTLEIRKVEVVRRQRNEIFVRGLSPHERLITSRIFAPVSGMELRTNGNNGSAGGNEES